MTPKRIDGHRHILSTKAHDFAKSIDPRRYEQMYVGVDADSAKTNRERDLVWNRKMADPDENIADMLAAGMDYGVLQPSPIGYYYWADGEAGATLARLTNEFTAAVVARKPQYFCGVATLPLQDPRRALAELDYAVGTLKLKGIAIGSNVRGKGYDEPEFFPVFERVNELGLPVFIHPNDPAGVERIRNYYLMNTLGYTLETTATAAKFVFSGMLDRLENLKFFLMHAGGTLPFLLGRLEHTQKVRPETAAHCKHMFSHYLKHFYVDTITFKTETLRFTAEIMPPGHLYMGTDYPYDMADVDPIGSVESAFADAGRREQIFAKTILDVM
jgi:aminocarboxymuconate-semialdehyde decarboxylase